MLVCNGWKRLTAGRTAFEFAAIYRPDPLAPHQASDEEKQAPENVNRREQKIGSRYRKNEARQ